MKVTAVLMWIGSPGSGGCPFFAGFYSKDIILESAFAAHTGLGCMPSGRVLLRH